MVETLFIAVFGSILSMMAPGPNFVAVASTALGSGRRAAIWVTMGVAAGTMLWVLVAAFSFGMLLAAQPALMALLKILGGAYLCWIAVRIILGLVSKNKSHFKQRRVRQSWMRHFWFGFVVVATNPKALMLWASLSTFLFDAGFAAWTVALFGPCAFVLSFLNYGAYAWVFSSQLAVKTTRKTASWLDAVTAACFGWFGGNILLEGVQEASR